MCGEVDGVRIISGNKCEILRKLSDVYIYIYNIHTEYNVLNGHHILKNGDHVNNFMEAACFETDIKL